jgi:hypothetical protein
VVKGKIRVRVKGVEKQEYGEGEIFNEKNFILGSENSGETFVAESYCKVVLI